MHTLVSGLVVDFTRYVLGCEPSSVVMIVADFGRGGLARGSVPDQATPIVKSAIWVMKILVCFTSPPSFHGFAVDGMHQNGSIYPYKTKKKRVLFALTISITLLSHL